MAQTPDLWITIKGDTTRLDEAKAILAAERLERILGPWRTRHGGFARRPSPARHRVRVLYGRRRGHGA